MKLVDKDAVVAEIKRAYNQEAQWMEKQGYTDYHQGLRDGYTNSLSFLDTLEVEEVEEVDLVKEISNWWDKHYDHNSKYKFGKYSGHYIENSTIITLAKHFFELGISVSNKTKKGE